MKHSLKSHPTGQDIETSVFSRKVCKHKIEKQIQQDQPNNHKFETLAFSANRANRKFETFVDKSASKQAQIRNIRFAPKRENRNCNTFVNKIGQSSKYSIQTFVNKIGQCAKLARNLKHQVRIIFGLLLDLVWSGSRTSSQKEANKNCKNGPPTAK